MCFIGYNGCNKSFMENLFRNRKISETPFRQDVLAIFKKHDHAIPLTVVEEELGNYNRVTLYRTIKVFLEKGILHEIAISGESSNYAICQEECDSDGHNHQHLHFKCKSCGVVSCVEIDRFPTISLSNYKIEHLEIQATGLCKNCTG